MQKLQLANEKFNCLFGYKISWQVTLELPRRFPGERRGKYWRRGRSNLRRPCGYWILGFPTGHLKMLPHPQFQILSIPKEAFTCKLFWNWNSTSGRAVGRYRQRDVERIGGRAHQPRDWHGPHLTQDQLRCELNLGDTFALFISSMKDMKKIFNLLIWFIDAIDDEVGRSWG